jgi:1-deoxy-D-xylulose-5-phosphate synthase
MFTAQKKLDHPIAIRYPRGRGRLLDWRQEFNTIKIGKGIALRSGTHLAVLSIGSMAYNVEDALANGDMNIAHFDMRFVKPLDESLLHDIFENFLEIITIEDGVINGGFGSAISEFASKHGYQNRIHILGIPDNFIEHGSIKQQHQSLKIDAGHLTMLFKSILQRLL